MTIDDLRLNFLDTEVRDDILLVTFKAEQLTDEDNIEELAHELGNLLSRSNHDAVILRFHHVTFATSSVLGKLIIVHRRMHRESRCLVLCEARGMMRDIFRTSRLSGYFTMTETLEEAIAYCQDQANGDCTDDENTSGVG